MKHAEEMQEQAYSDAPGDCDYPRKVLLMELSFSIACFSANSFLYLQTESYKHD